MGTNEDQTKAQYPTTGTSLPTGHQMNAGMATLVKPPQHNLSVKGEVSIILHVK